ncbi:ribonucleoside-diphosphate reductase subunit alpha [Roseofilum casamattae]|uniref:Ribonucleoside-diphosphate reductase n=1 Tax=Roseofilum casamattae BLCC-M143 TaxID=3022442 RepID=A0ABT7BT06_9CYAN|nr:ribonucleoside-diphosphate reductase subunit alpha [Roseofilum casamattae]MDJ1181927.1 ribonucleoside-diphosphate reductase subunit alpha [Roseofilum casamattae BLCC-M143]
MIQPTLPITATSTHTSEIQAIKRDGTRAPLDITKIRTVVGWACEGTNANPISLEAGLTTRLRDGVTTREIQENLINCSLELCSPEEPDWRYVAGRLHIWNLWKETLVSRGYRYGDYPKTVARKVAADEYDERILTYTPDELVIANSWINPDWDADYDYAGAVLLTKRYLLKDELPQEAYLTCALLLASVEDREHRLQRAEQFYQAIAKRKISLATPILANLRVPGGSLSSCFITAMDDNLESIYETLTDTARISKNGGGVGVNVSRIRATSSWVMGKENASGGIIPWIKLLNDTAIAVNQGGRRAGAVTVSVDIWHLDVIEFLEMQTENGDQRRKAYDIFPQLVVPDEFMRRVIAKEDWTLVDPYEVKAKLGINLPTLWGEEFERAYQIIEAEIGKTLVLYNQINARELFKSIMRTQVETGMPYLAFKDTINRANPNQHEGYIPGVNLCCESFSNVSPSKEAHCCNLNSLNLANLEVEDLPEICRIAVRMLDNTIELTHAPFAASRAHNDKYRTIGVGAMGLADWIAKKQLSYDSLPEISHFFEEMGYWCTVASMELAKERGAYASFAGSEWSKGHLIGAKPVEWFTENSDNPERWMQLSEDIKTHGIRNSHITAIAPNTSSSLVQGCTASVLPAYSRFFYDKWAKGSVPIAPPFISDRLWFYQENKHAKQQKVVRVVSVIQQWIDTGISMELLFNLNAGVYFPDEPEKTLKAKDIFDTLVMAWQEQCKAVYYVRTVQRDDFKESGNDCTSCAN